MHRQARKTLRKMLGGSLLVLSVMVTPALPQVTIGDNVNMTMSGNLGMGYSGNFGNSGVSGHGLFGSGMALLSGSYYNPNFLSFHLRPFYNRNQDNSSYGSVLSETGFDASTSIFSGSHFPGSISYSRSFASGSQYGIPGAIGLSSDNDTQDFSITWSEILPNLPSLTATFSDNTSSSTILGLPGTSDTASRNLNLVSNYQIDGFHLLGFVNHQNYNVTLPAFLSLAGTTSDSASTSYGVSATHALPLSGTVMVGYNRTDYSSETGTYRSHGSTDMAESVVAIKPTERLTLTGQVRYTGNLIGALQQAFIPGGLSPLLANEESSHGISLSTYGTYNLGHGFILVGYANRQAQTFAGNTYNYNQFGGTLTYSYSRPLFGLLYFSFGLVNNGTNSGGNSLGFVGNVTLKRRAGRWEYDADFSYSQNVQAIVASYTTSNYNYGGSIRRRFGTNLYWSGSYRGLQSGLAQLPGYSNRSDSFVTTFTRGKYGLSATYSQSSGTALLSSTGVLTPTPLAPLITPDQVIYGGKVYGAGLYATPVRKMLINVNWYQVRSNTQTVALFSGNNSERYYAQMQYNLRKLSFRAGYWRVYQSIGPNTFRPALDNTYFFNISRWFNLF